MLYAPFFSILDAGFSESPTPPPFGPPMSMHRPTYQRDFCGNPLGNPIGLPAAPIYNPKYIQG